jgi:hypothetical protein
VLVRRLRPSPATAIALIALFVSLGGTTYAVSSLPRDSVGTKQLRNRAVTEDELSNRAVISSKLATGAVTNSKIARRTITGSRIAADALGGAQIQEGALGPVPFALDAENAKLAARASTADHAERANRSDRTDRAAVADSLARVEYEIAETSIPEGGGRAVDVPCPAGTVAVGGGFWQTGDPDDLTFIADSAPGDDRTLWRVVVFDAGGDTGQPTPGDVYAVCLSAEPA